MKHDEFRTYFEQHAQAYEAWGRKIVAEIDHILQKRLGERYPSFLKIAPEPRVKGMGSAIGKIIRKNYSAPVEQMTDLVGVRFVVLFKSDIEVISQIIEGSTLWNASLDRDYDDEIKEEPNHFDYQSKHYILRANGNIPYGSLTIPNQLACEIQLRTILQHAYAEIVHDNIYKPTGVVPHKSKRLVARSMALMETTDDLFTDTIKELEIANTLRNETYLLILNEFTTFVDTTHSEIDIDFNYSVIDLLKDKIKKINDDSLSDFLKSKPYIKNRIVARYGKHFLFTQPSVLLLYFLATDWDTEIKRDWMFGSLRKELDMVFSDLGIAQDSFIA